MNVVIAYKTLISFVIHKNQIEIQEETFNKYAKFWIKSKSFSFIDC